MNAKGLQDAEALLLVRERNVTIRERAIDEALRAGTTDERLIADIVARLVQSLPPPISVSAFVFELEKHAVSLQATDAALQRKGEDLQHQQQLLDRQVIALQRQEERLQQWASTLAEAAEAVCSQEASSGERERQRAAEEAEVAVWAAQMRDQKEVDQRRDAVRRARDRHTSAADHQAVRDMLRRELPPKPPLPHSDDSSIARDAMRDLVQEIANTRETWAENQTLDLQ